MLGHLYEIVKGLSTLGRFAAVFTRETSFVIFCLLSSVKQKNEFTPFPEGR